MTSVADTVFRVRRLIPDDGHALLLAVLHDRVAPILLRIFEDVSEAARRVVDGDELGVAQKMVDDDCR